MDIGQELSELNHDLHQHSHSGTRSSQILSVAMVFLRLKYEPRGIVGLAAASLFFAVLAVVLALGSIGH